MEIQYTQVDYEVQSDYIDLFCDENGGENGIIPDEEYDKIFDHLGSILSKYASYSGEGEIKDFSGYRYVDQILNVNTVCKGNATPYVAAKAGIEAVKAAHRAFLPSFEFEGENGGHYILVKEGGTVTGTYTKIEFNASEI